MQIDIGFDQLVQAAKRLPKTQWKGLKREVENEIDSVREASELETFLLTAPTFNKEQFDTIAETRKDINNWRAK